VNDELEMKSYAERLKDANDKLDLLRSLERHEGFKVYLGVLGENLQAMRNQYELAEVTGMDGLIVQESLRAGVAATRLALEYVSLRVKELEEEKSLISETIRELKGDE